MPSGAKKRKAAKKKKEKQATNSHLGEVQEERESDGGETNSPMSQDQQNHQHFAEGEDSSSIQSAATEGDSVEGVNGNGENFDKVAVEEKSDIQIDRENKLEDDFERNKVIIEHIEFEKKSSSSTSSSSSSSDDESKFVNKNIEVINWEDPIEYSPNLPAEAAAIVDLQETTDLPETAQVNDVISHNLAVVTPEEESYKDVSVVSTETVPVVDDHDLVAAKSKVDDHLIEDLDLKVDSKGENSGVPSTEIDTGSQSVVDIVSTKETVVEEEVSKTLPQSSVPAVDTVNGTEHKKTSEIESLDRQTPVALPSRPVQTTSSMGCCGLFELFTGSNR